MFPPSMSKLAAALAVAVFFSCGAARAQPYDYDAQVTTSPSQIIPINNNRRHIEFCNPNASIAVAICPANSRRTGAALVCAFNGRGSITIAPSWCWGLTTVNPGDLGGAWNGIAASGTANITVLEY